MSSTKEQIQEASKKKLALVPFTVPGTELEVFIRPMRLGERSSWLNDIRKMGDKFDAQVMCRIAAISVVNENGEALFSEAEFVDLDASIGDEIYKKVAEVNNIGTDAVKEKEKN